MAKRRKVQEVREEEHKEEFITTVVKEEPDEESLPVVKEEVMKSEEVEVPVVKEKPDEESSSVVKEVVMPKNEIKKPKVVTKPKATFETLYEEAKKDPVILPIAESIKDYINICYMQKSQDGATVSNMNYNLFNLIIGALNDNDKSASNKKMTFINKVFLVEKDRYFSTISLCRYDHFWSFGPESKMGYIMLIKFISDLSNPNTRKAKAKVLSADKMAKFLPEGIVGKLESFYKL